MDLFINPWFSNIQLTKLLLTKFLLLKHKVFQWRIFLAYVKATDAVMINMQNQLTILTELITKFVNSNSAFTSSSGTLPSNTIANLKSDLKEITTRSEATKDTVHPTNNESTEDVQPQVVQSKSLILTSEPVSSPNIKPIAYPASGSRPNFRPSIPYPSRMQDQKLRDKANDQRDKIFQIFKDLNFNISFADALILMPKIGPSIKSLLTNKDKLCELTRIPLNEHCSVVLLKKLPEKLGDPGKFLIPCDFPGKNKLLLPDLTPTYMTLELADRSISSPVEVAEDVYVKVGELTLCVGKEAITFILDQTSRYSANYSNMTAKRIDIIDMACEEYSQEVLGFSNVITSGNPTPYDDPIVSTTSPTLTPIEKSDFHLEEVDAFLAIKDDPTSPEVDQSYLDPEGDILLLEAFLHDDPSLPLPNQGNYLPEVHQEKTTFTCPYGTFAYRRMHFGLCNAPDMFQRCMMAIFHDMIEKIIEVFMDDFSVFGNSFQSCLSHLEKMLNRCEDTNLCLNWEKSHFIVKEGIVLGHKISKQGIDVDKAKVDVITKLPHLTTVKG
nr:reverse transcriptase domain-containing protein [Tanacetum cinerariifolium]